MAKAAPVDPQEVYDHLDPEAVANAMAQEVVLVAMPMNTFKAITAAAVARGMSAAQLLNEAIMPYIEDIDTEKKEAV